MRVVNATNLKVFRLEPDTLYEFKVLSINTYGNGNFSEVKLVRTLGRLTHGILYTQIKLVRTLGRLTHGILYTQVKLVRTLGRLTHGILLYTHKL